jgi:hypothetical protein|uniref:TLC domain-containing protein n=1 Tax=viral metagenome TaxID=1070528 RepID=A0A6C0C0Z9_9ZZZZ
MISTFFKNYDYNAFYSAAFFSGCISITYPILRNYLSNNYINFRNIPLHKQNYSVKNLIKSSILCSLCFISVPTIVIPVYFRGYWSNWWCHRLGVLYTVNDTLGLLLVDKLPASTKLHHRITTTLCLMSLGIDFQTSTLGQMMYVYTLASAGAYLVNYYLGLRLLFDKKEGEKLNYIKRRARDIYFISCLLNWGWHTLWTIRNYNLIGIQHMMYFFFLSYIIKDDLILLNWLNK